MLTFLKVKRICVFKYNFLLFAVVFLYFSSKIQVEQLVYTLIKDKLH